MAKKELFPIYGLWHKPFWQTTTFYILLGIILFGMLSLIIWFFVRKYLKQKSKQTAGQKALFSLEKLKKFVLQDKISPKFFYLSITEIIKRYLFERFGYDLFGYTDEEVIKFLENKKFDKNLLEKIKDMCESMQLVKFAAKSAAKELMEKDLEKSILLINKTKIRKNNKINKK